METQSTSRENELKTKKICRFCLTQELSKLESIYTRDAKFKNSVPLPIQVQACVSLEVYSNDGMPMWVCIDCRLLFEHSYRFKQMCKRGELLLRQYPLTGEWPNPLLKPKFPQNMSATVSVQSVEELPTSTAHLPIEQTNLNLKPKIQGQQLKQLQTQRQQQKVSNVSTPKRKLLNSNPVESPEPPAPLRMKKEKLDDDTSRFLDKVENNEELSMDDVQRLLAAVEDDEELAPAKPKLLNKSSIRILNKDADIVVEPRISEIHLKRDDDGNVAIVTEIIDPNVEFDNEPDRIKNAAPVETNVYPCPCCERSFPLRQLRDIHMVNHNRERSFLCADCNKSFFSKYDLQKHSLTHTVDHPFKCTICPKSFNRASLLHRHERLHTDIPKFICVFCEKAFISHDEMEKHTAKHRKNRPHVCKLCNKAFAFKQGLERHEIIHSREQPYPCQYCDLSFSTPSKLARHLTVHAGTRPYPCKYCPKSFLLSHHLTRHSRSHRQATDDDNDNGGYKCFDCHKMYKTREEHIYHSAVHATQTLVCSLCQESFSDVAAVTAHIKEHAEGEPHACEFCDFIYLSAERLQQHTDDDHADEMAAYLENDKTPQLTSIEEFLVDELPEERMSQSHVIVGNNKSTEEHMVLDEGPPRIVNTRKQLSAVGSDKKRTITPKAIQPTAAKIRKVVLKNAEPVLKMTQELNSRKVSSQTELRTVKIEKEEINAPTLTNNASTITNTITIKQSKINSVLNALPKSVSVRRNDSTAPTTSSAAATVALAVKNATAAVAQRNLRVASSRVKAEQTSPGTSQNNTISKVTKQQSPTLSMDESKMDKGKTSPPEKKGRLHLKDRQIVISKLRASK